MVLGKPSSVSFIISPSSANTSFPMRHFFSLELLTLLCAILSVRADTEVLTLSLPFHFDPKTSSTTGLIPSSPDLTISSWKKSVRFQTTESDSSKKTIPFGNDQQSQQEQTRDVWVELDSDSLSERKTGKAKGMIKVSWLARPSTTLSIAGPVMNPSDPSKIYLKISTIYLTTQQIPELIITLEPLHLGVIPSSSLPLVGMLLMIFIGLRRIGAYNWLIRRVVSIVENDSDKPR